MAAAEAEAARRPSRGVRGGGGDGDGEVGKVEAATVEEGTERAAEVRAAVVTALDSVEEAGSQALHGALPAHRPHEFSRLLCRERSSTTISGRRTYLYVILNHNMLVPV